jgi:AcrR family transcriptional regulator
MVIIDLRSRAMKKLHSPPAAPPPPVSLPGAPLTRPGRRERHRAEIRDRLYRAALDLFAKRGYFETTVEDITEAADVGKGTFFNYFPTKEHVLATYGDERVAHVDRALHAVRSGQVKPLDALRNLATTAAGQSTSSPDLLRAIFAAHLSSDSVRSDLQRRLRRARGLMAEIIGIGQERGEISRDLSAGELARLTHTIFFGVMIAWAINPEGSFSGKAQDIWNLISQAWVAELNQKGKTSQQTHPAKPLKGRGYDHPDLR